MINWVKLNAAWLQGLFVAGLALATDFGVKLTQDQQTDLIAFTAILFGISAHQAAKSARGDI